MLAPADLRGDRNAHKATQQKRAGLAANLFSAFRGWEPPSQSDAQVADLATATASRAAEVDALEQGREEPAVQADISAFLRPVGVMEMRYIRMLSSLSSMTYYMDKVTPEALHRRHRLQLVTTSLACQLAMREPPRSPAAAFEMGDAMAADPASVEREQALLAGGGSARASAAVATLSPPPPVRRTLSFDERSTPGSGSRTGGAAAPTAAAPGSLSNNITSFTMGMASALPMRSVAAQLQGAAAAGHSTAAATVATVSAAVQATWGGDSRRKECQSPTEWFVADGNEGSTRYFVVQGSDNLDHWKVNLTFDPVDFEDHGLGVRVHRGVYEAAQSLYQRFLPLVEEHLARSPFGRVAFVGHSLGGSLGTLLMLMLVRRGAVPPERLATTYTFGAPAVLCEGAAGECGCVLAYDGGSGGPACSAGGGLLRALGLPPAAVRNVIMHRDIVPRAFACDYSPVADLLRRVGGAFRTHACLSGPRQVLFDFLGQVIVLQPEEGASFVSGDGYHALLPAAPGMFVLRDRAPGPGDTAGAATPVSNLVTAAAAAMDADASAGSTPPGQRGGESSPMAAAAGGGVYRWDAPCAPGSPLRSARDAVWVLMNSPHPLDILADPGAYGDTGSISRYHNPDHYTRAIGGALRARGGTSRLLVERAAAAGVRFHAPAIAPASDRLAQRLQRCAAPGAAPGGGKASLVPAVHKHHAPWPAAGV